MAPRGCYINYTHNAKVLDKHLKQHWWCNVPLHFAKYTITCLMYKAEILSWSWHILSNTERVHLQKNIYVLSKWIKCHQKHLCWSLGYTTKPIGMWLLFILRCTGPKCWSKVWSFCILIKKTRIIKKQYLTSLIFSQQTLTCQSKKSTGVCSMACFHMYFSGRKRCGRTLGCVCAVREKHVCRVWLILAR